MELCWCQRLPPMKIQTKLVILMHPKEFKQEKAATGRFVHLSFEGSEIIMGLGFDENPGVQSLITDPDKYCVVLYPSSESVTLGKKGDLRASGFTVPEGKQLVVFVLDATWACAAKMFRLSPTLQALPRIQFLPGSPSRYYIKRQPRPECLSTLEACHELMIALESEGLDVYPRPRQLLDAFASMQAFMESCARSNAGTARSYRHKGPAVLDSNGGA